MNIKTSNPARNLFLRYLISVIGIVTVILILNLLLIFGWLYYFQPKATVIPSIKQVSDALEKGETGYTLNLPAVGNEHQFLWLMLIDEVGQVVWAQNLPSDLPRHYTINDIASMTRWFLQDYPVSVWTRDDGLLVGGMPKWTVWKYPIEMTLAVVRNLPLLALAFLIGNLLLALIFATASGVRTFKAIKQLATGIEQMERNQPTSLNLGGVFADVSERINQTSQKLNAQKVALQQRDTARTNWTTGVSHDIRTPLSVIMGYASRMESDVGNPPETQMQAAIIRSQSERIRDLVADLNLISKLSYDLQPLTIIEESPMKLTREVVAEILNSGLGDQHTIQIADAENSTEYRARVDKKLMKRSISNLIQNAIQHNPKGCTITVTLAYPPGCVEWRVEDNGKGFDPQQLGNFNQSNQEAAFPERKIGLNLVRQIVLTHQGCLQFSNQVNGGAVITLRIPAALYN